MSSKSHRLTIRVSNELKERIQKIADEKGVSFTAICLDLITKGLKPDTEIKCIAESFIDSKYKCVWGRVDNTPNIKYLALEDDEKDDACQSCRGTLGFIVENLRLIKM